MDVIELKTTKRTEFIDITEKVNELLHGSHSAALIFTKHTTTGLTINENEEGLIEDMETFFSRIVPEGHYRHDRIDNNADSHLRSLLLEHSLMLPISNGKLGLGTWQKVFFVELDGPRKRNVSIKLL